MKIAKSSELIVVLGCVGLGGCSFSASASGSVNTGGDSEASAEAEFSSGSEEAEPATITYKEGKLDYQGVINFEYNKASLQGDAETTNTLNDFAAFLKKHDEVSIEIEGHTDSRGTDAYNRNLSDRRAASVREWLIANGIDAERLTAVGKGEDDPQVPEPAECDDQVPVDTTPCEEAWAKNRRVVFEVTEGGETLPDEVEPEPEPLAEPKPEPPADPKPDEECPWLWGGHFNAVGPNSWVIGAGAMQPGICWLEPSLGLGLGFGGVEADDPPPNASADGHYWALNVPLRARIWFMDRHSVIGDVGLGLARYWISADMTDSAGATAEYHRNSTNIHGHLGVGYGFRPNGAQAGPRLGVVIGGLLTFNDLKDPEVSNVDAAFNIAEGVELADALNVDTDRIPKLEPYGEISFGWLF